MLLILKIKVRTVIGLFFGEREPTDRAIENNIYWRK
jgi:hypothetical protein